ncbi:hypothetical protein B1729_18995 [Microbacterium sp. B35-04]|nr:hypothetical protein B1729_18995 [Microbacterium sp. B35-04]
MLLLGVIAIALLPALWQGIIYSSQQSSTATATRYMNSIVEDARGNPNCAHLNAIPSLPAVTDGRGVSMTTATSSVTCANGDTATLVLNIVGEGRTLATSTALIYIPIP